MAAKSASMHLLVTTHNYDVVIDEDIEAKQIVTAEDRNVEWNGVQFKVVDLEVWAIPDEVTNNGGILTIVPGAVTVAFTDNTDSAPGAVQNANIRQTLERPLPGGSMGPLYVTVS